MGCSDNDSEASAQHSDDPALARLAAAEARYAAAVGSAPPTCGEEYLYRIQGKHSAAGERFLKAALHFNPVYCSGTTEDELIAAAKTSVSSMPELCAAAEALPKGWYFSANGEGDLPDDLTDQAVKQWVSATNGGPVAEVYGGGEPEPPDDDDKTPHDRYLASQRAMMAAVEEYC